MPEDCCSVSDFLEHTTASRLHEFVVVSKTDYALAKAALSRNDATIKLQHKLLESAGIVIGGLLVLRGLRG